MSINYKTLKILTAGILTMFMLTACSSEETTTTTEVATQGVETTVETATAEEEYVYAMMNIPYNEFYAAELSDNDVEVDAVTSATTSKWKNYAYTYSAESSDGSGGGAIFGPNYPVYISEDLFDELSALAETDDYFVVALDEEPQAYKEVTGEVGSLDFSEIIGGTETVVTASDYEWSMTYPSNWGDFEIALDDIPEMSTIYGVELVTDSGKSYGLRTLENIWSSGTQLSWGLGYKEMINKGNVLSSDHYADMQGQTITEIIYYVPEGTVVVEADVYVPYFFADTLFTMGEGSVVQVADTTATINYVDGVEIPDDFDMTLAVKRTSSGEYVDSFVLADDYSSITWSEDLPVGQYTVELKDANDVYMIYAVKVTFQTDVIPVSFNEDTLTIESVGDDADLFLAGISKYSVTKEGEESATSYNVSESHGTPGTPLLTEDNAIDLATESADGPIFESGVTYTISISVTGYTTFEFSFTA